MMRSTVQGSTMTQMANAYGISNDTRTQKEKNDVQKTGQTETVQKTGQISGRVIGNAKLSEKAAKYYDQLKSKFSDMEFILVSEDQKQMAQAQAASFGNASKPVVLINEEKLEKMAEDEKYRSRYEGLIAGAAGQLKSMGERLGSSVKAYGMQVDDKGIASYFAVVDKSFAAQRKLMAKKAAKKKADEKAAAKRAEKQKQEEAIKNKKSEQNKKTDASDSASDAEELETVTASSVDALVDKVKDLTMQTLSDLAQTEEERKVGQYFDFKL